MRTIKAQDIPRLKHTTISHNASLKKKSNVYNININQTKNTSNSIPIQNLLKI